MRKTILLIGLLLITMAHTALAEQRGVFMEFHRKINPGKNMQVNRAPMRMPIEVVYDSDTHNIKVIGSNDIEAEVFLYDIAAVVADVIVIGASMADNGANVLQAVENGDILSLDLQKIGGDEIINKKIDDTILKSLVLQGETHSKIETVQNIAKATYYEFK